MSFIAQQSYKIDLTPQGGYVMVYVSQHDDEAREIVFKIHNQGKVFDIPANINISVQGVKSNGGYFTHNCTYSGNLVTMPIADDMTDVIGKAVCVLKFTNASEEKLATAKFILNVDSDSSSEGIIIDTVAEEIFDQLMDEIRAQAAIININIATLRSMVGTPLIAAIAAGMTDHNKIYVYTGNETGYTYGDWYYWDGSAWTSGGQYNSVPIIIDQIPTSGSTNVVSSNGVYTALGNKVDKVSGKGLSTEDYTTAEKAKLAGLEQVTVDPTLTIPGQAADSKVTGDKIAKLNINLSDYCGIESKVFIAQEGNKYLNGNGVITSASGSFHVSEPIAVVANSEVHFIATGHTSSFTMIATCDSEGANILPQVHAIYGSTAEEHEYVYRIIEDGYIMLSYNYSKHAELIILSNASNAALNYSVNDLKDTVERFCGVEHKSFTNQIGKKYVTGTGVVSTASGTYHVTNPIEVQADTEVHFIARGNTSNFTMISTCDSEGTSVSAKIGAKSDGEEHDYVYKVLEDGYIILSYNYSYPAKLYILSDISNAVLKKSVDGLDSRVDGLNDVVDGLNSGVGELNDAVDELDNAVKGFNGVVIGNNGNLINHRTMTDKKAISTAGVITDNIEYAITDKILLKPSTVYSYRELSRIVFFDSTDTRISATELYNSTTGTFTTPASVAYGIANIHKATDPSGTGTVYNEYQWQLVEGDTLPDYERQYQTLNGYNIIDNVLAVGGNNYAFRRWNKTCFDRMPVFLVDAESDAVTSEDKTSTAILAKYDALMADNTGYITKTAIGTASNNETIYRYDFKMPSITGASGEAFERADILPKIICISGVHPEFGGIYGLYNAMREITNNDSLSDLKTGIHFIVIPVANPYGIENNTRANANGIDMARNYEIDYIANSGSQAQGTWSGLSALSEVEAQIIDGVMADNKDAIMFMSCHSFQKDSKKRVMWGSCATKYMVNIVGKTAYKLTDAWKKEYPNFDWNGNDTASILGILSLATEPGSEGKQATKYGIQGLTFETSDYFPLESQNPLTAFAISRNSETYINFILTVLGCWESTDPKDM